jgi:hypothetical protein
MIGTVIELAISINVQAVPELTNIENFIIRGCNSDVVSNVAKDRLRPYSHAASRKGPLECPPSPISCPPSELGVFDF